MEAEKTERKLVQARLTSATVNKLNLLKKRLSRPSGADALASAVDIADIIVQAMERGEKVVITGADGSRREVILPGVKTV